MIAYVCQLLPLAYWIAYRIAIGMLLACYSLRHSNFTHYTFRQAAPLHNYLYIALYAA